MRINTSLSSKILFGILGLLLAGFLVAGYIAGVRKDIIVEKIYYDQSLLIASMLDSSISKINLEDTESLQQQIYKYTWLNPDILHLSISRWENENLVVVASTDFDLIGSRSSDENLRVYNQDDPSSLSKEIKGVEAVIATSPIHVGGKVVGTYSMALSVQSSNEYILQSAKDLSGVVLITMFVVILAVWILLRSMIIEPIHDLVKNVKEFSEGKLDKRIIVKSNDEISTLAHGFNNMAEKLHNSQKELEMEIKKQTKELELAKSDLEDQGLAILNVLEDVSEEKEYEAMRSQSLLETVNEGIVIVNERGLVEYVNPAFEKLLGFSEESLKGKILADELDTYDLNDKKLPPKTLASSSVVTQGGGETKIQVVAKNKEKLAVSISAAPIYQAKEFKGVVMVFHDFSQDLKIAKQKDDFFSIASHELRTPLTVMSGNLDMIVSGVGGSKLTKEDRSMLSDSLDSSDRLIRMVSDFLNVSRLDQGRLSLHDDKVDIHAMIMEISKNYSSIVDKKGLKLITNCPSSKPVMVEGDEDKLREVIINLLGNSLKFTAKGEITIGSKLKGDMLEVRVSDTGSGIAKKNQDLLFQRFQQAMSRTLAREAGGTGLGLYISREFMRKMGGDLYLLDSKEGKGSTFAFTIPLVGESKDKKN